MLSSTTLKHLNNRDDELTTETSRGLCPLGEPLRVRTRVNELETGANEHGLCEGWEVADISLAEEGARRVDWARSRMPVLANFVTKPSKLNPLLG